MVGGHPGVHGEPLTGREVTDSNRPGGERQPKLRRPTRIFPYGRFLLHLLVFGSTGFYMAYGTTVPLNILYAHGGVTVIGYLGMYYHAFGVDSLKWIVTNATLGLYGVAVEVDLLLSLFDRGIADYPLATHVVPFSYYVLYMFLLRRAMLAISGAESDEAKGRRLGRVFVVGSLVLYSGIAAINVLR